MANQIQITTRGPWYANTYGKCGTVFIENEPREESTDRGVIVAQLCSNRAADAQLLAAAPSMLAALRVVEKHCASLGGDAHLPANVRHLVRLSISLALEV